MDKGDHDDLRRSTLFEQSNAGVGCGSCGQHVVHQQDRGLDQAGIRLKPKCPFDIEEPLPSIQLWLGAGWLFTDQ